MILRSLRFASVGQPFKDREVALDFSALPAGVYAFVGSNGGGKSTTLELSGPATLYRRFPSYRDNFVQHAVTRQAFSELIFEAGGEMHRVIVQADPKAASGKGKTEAFWYEWAGIGDPLLVVSTEATRQHWQPVAGPLLADFDAYRDRFFPSLELLLAGPFCAQKVTKGNGSFFAADPADRKRLFVEALGLGRLEELAEGYSDQVRMKRGELGEICAELAGLGDADHDADLGTKRPRLMLEAERLAGILTEHEGLKSRRADALRDAKKAQADQAQATERYTTALRAYGAESKAIEHEIDALKLEQKRLTELDAKQATLPSDDDLTAGRAKLRERERLLETFKQMAESTAAKARDAQPSFDQAVRTRDRLGERLNALRPQAGAIAGVNLALEICQRCTLTQHSIAAKREIDEKAGQYEIEEQRVLSAEHMLAGLQFARDTTAGAFKDQSNEVMGLRHDLGVMETARASIPADLPAQWTAYQKRVTALAERQDRHQPPVKPTHEKLPKLAELEQSLSDADASLRHARQKHQDAARALQDVETRLSIAQERQTRLTALSSERATVAKDLAALELLAAGLGKSGLQAVYIDQAGPVVERLTNQLLHETFGPRFSVGFDTRRLKKGFKPSDVGAYSEVFDVRILDAWAGEERTQGSGGETVWMESAFRLALSIYVTQQSGKEMRTLFMDEPSGGLSTEFAPKFPEMLKAARAIGGFHHAFLVSHQREVWGVCDGFFVFKGGTVTYASDVESVDAMLKEGERE